MKKFVLLALLSACTAQADVFNLSSGETRTIGGHQVSCNGGHSAPSGRCSASENPYAVCISSGYQPSTCSALTDGCAAGQAACLSRGYQPSTCAGSRGRPGSGRCNTAKENPYVVCMNAGYQPSTCAVLVDGCAAGQAACLNQGYQPSSCAQH